MRVRQNGDIVMMMITSTGDETDVRDGKNLRRLALGLKVPIVTTVAGARATAQVGPLAEHCSIRQIITCLTPMQYQSTCSTNP